jgi:16S rRNA (uracil1498-N3)-methyltransferase
LEYYFTPKEYISPGSLTIVDDEAKHLARVLRKKSGEEIYVTDGRGSLYKVKITGISKELINCSVIEKFENLNESPVKITLYQSLIKNPDRLEFVIEKSVELGIHSIQPVITENVINKTTSKTERWQAIALSAMKQSQRCYLPKVNPPVTFNEAVSSVKSGLKLIAHEKSGEPLSGLNSTNEVHLFIGPEGGFTDEEINTAVGNGFNIIKLGARKYRSETAALLSVGLLLNK